MEIGLENLLKKFQNTTAADHVSYTIQKGVYGLGANGTGKITLMCMMCLLVKPDPVNIHSYDFSLPR